MTPFSLNLNGRLTVYDHPVVMGIINATPDSFYEGSRVMPSQLAERAVSMVNQGADIIDIGAYSSRPGANPVTEAEEISRLQIALTEIRAVLPDTPISIDTFRASVALRAVSDFGANIINDISGGDLDPDMFTTVSRLQVPYVLMHMRGTPQTMQSLTSYEAVTADVINDLSHKLRQLRLMGVADVMVDPGFGFAKTLQQNYELMGHLPVIEKAFPEVPLLVGISRKSMITKLLDISPQEALNGTTALNAMALILGASILRVHDVKAAVETVKIFNALKQEPNGTLWAS